LGFFGLEERKVLIVERNEVELQNVDWILVAEGSLQ
jgi:hypothetical protein